MAKKREYIANSLADRDWRLGMLQFWMELMVSVAPKLNKVLLRISSTAIIAPDFTCIKAGGGEFDVKCLLVADILVVKQVRYNGK